MTGMHRLALAAALAGLAASAPLAGGDAAHPASTHAPSWEADIAKPGEPGRPFVLEGRVLGGLDGKQPLRDVTVYVYHAADDGNYYSPGNKDPRIRGTLHTNIMGEYRVRSVLPGMAEGVPHIHIELTAPGTPSRGITLTLARSSGPGSDTTYKRLPYMIKLPEWNWAYVYRDSAGTFRCHFDIPYASGYTLVPSDSD